MQSYERALETPADPLTKATGHLLEGNQKEGGLLMPLFQFMSSSELAELLRAPEKAQSVRVVDVRDDDYVGGHIKSSLHVPSLSFQDEVDSLVQRLMTVDMVVFHCALSQQRGPASARKYVEARDAQFPNNEAKQRVFVLSGGFNRFVKTYHGDPVLVEDFDPRYADD